MSWSICLSGSTASVLDELESAQKLIGHTLEELYGIDSEDVSVTISGSAYAQPDGTSGCGGSFYISGTNPAPVTTPDPAAETPQSV